MEAKKEEREEEEEKENEAKAGGRLGPRGAYAKCAVRKSMLVHHAGMLPPLAEIIVEYALGFIRWCGKKGGKNGEEVGYSASYQDSRSSSVCIVNAIDTVLISAVGNVAETCPAWSIVVIQPKADLQICSVSGLFEVGLGNDKSNRSWVSVHRRNPYMGRYEVGKQGRIIMWRDFKWPPDSDYAHVDPTKPKGVACFTVMRWEVKDGVRATVRIGAIEGFDFGEIDGLDRFRPYLRSHPFSTPGGNASRVFNVTAEKIPKSAS